MREGFLARRLLSRQGFMLRRVGGSPDTGHDLSGHADAQTHQTRHGAERRDDKGHPGDR
ncbi:hypothetical protein ACFRCW_28930 [Streptomyces sp. NPDC056653]|uniref:hypothetical protein n=1 Tax=Streptomyces sp. NPDC056653 TaxID=3345894 RepID=UPI00367FAF7E